MVTATYCIFHPSQCGQVQVGSVLRIFQQEEVRQRPSVWRA
jgi:hypothetical protein